jgi:segment polarity protein dishevelled
MQMIVFPTQICPQTLSTATSSTSSLPPSSSNILNATVLNSITKIFIYIDSNRDDANEPFSIKLNKSSTSITLDDFLVAIPRSYTKNYKYFFKSIDPVLGIIREEITDRKQLLPSANGRIAAWLMPAALAQHTTNDISATTTTANTSYRRRNRQQDDSLFTSDTSASEMTDVASQIDHDEDDRFSSITETTNTTDTSSNYNRRRRRRRRRHYHHHRRERASSMSSMTDSTISMDVVTVVLSLERIKYLGMTVVGESDGGIIVGSIMKGGAVDADGRIQPGDMILQMNDISFEHISNSDAVRLLRETVKDAKSIKLVIAKRWNDHQGLLDDDDSHGYYPFPHQAVMNNNVRQDPIRPIDPRQWIAQTNAVLMRRRSSLSPLPPAASSTLSSSSTSNSPHNHNGIQKYHYDLNLTRNSDMETICRAMQQTHSGLDIRDRLWLKIILKNSFLGSDLVHWLYKHVDGFIDKQDAKEYACALLERGYIRHPIVGLLTRGFSKSCYYVFGHFNNDNDDESQTNEMSQLTLGESTPHYDAITRPTYGFLDKHNVPVLYASTSSLSSYNKKSKSQSSGESGGGGGGIRMTPLSYLANNNATFSTIRSHHRPNNNSTCTTDNSIITI